MDYVFSSVTQTLLNSGKLTQAVNSLGQLLPIARDPITGRFVEIAKAATLDGSRINPLLSLINSGGSIVMNPLLAPAQLATGLVQIGQTHLGFQKTYRELDIVKAGIQTLQNSVGILQATTAVIGLGVAVTGVLAAVNLYQTLKLKEDVKQLRLEVKDGFIDLKKAFCNQGQLIINRIDEVAQDIKFEQHRLILIRAYGQFSQAMQRLQVALKIEETNARNAQINGVLDTLYKALADYSNPQLFSETCAAGRLRRLECAWAIEQAIITAYQFQNQLTAASEHLEQLQDKMRQAFLSMIEQCDSQEELDFLFPEIARLKIHDCTSLEAWQNQTDWMKTLSSDEREQLSMLEFAEETVNFEKYSNEITAEPWEMQLYKDLKKKSNYSALQDQLKFIVKPELRRHHESYIQEQAIPNNRPGFAPSNWQEVPDLTVANLYYYLKIQEESLKKS